MFSINLSRIKPKKIWLQIWGKFIIKLKIIFKKFYYLENPDKKWAKFFFHAQQGSRNELVSIIPEGFTYPIYLRRGTSDIKNFEQIFLSKEYDFLKEEPKTILDLGGYVGLASTFLANKYPNAKILLVEPDPDNFIIAKLNTRQFNNIECINCGVWSKKCDLTILSKVKNEDWGIILREVSEKESVSPRIKAMSILDFMNYGNMESIDFLKIDIEGSEKEIFSHVSSKEWIRKSKIISCELHDRMVKGCSDAFHNALNGEGFTHRKHGEFDYYFRN